MLSAERILENIKIRSDSAKDKVLVFWCRILSNRNEMCRRINLLKGDLDLTPIVLHDRGFDNPNAVLSDLNRLIREHRNEFDRGPRPEYNDPSPTILLLLSRTEFTLPQISSLITLPDWFPRAGGQSVFIMIEDLTTTADCPMNAPEAHISDLCEKIFTLEVALVKRMSSVLKKDRHSGQGLFALIRRTEDETYANFLSESAKYHNEINNPAGFRPSLKETRSLVGRLLMVMRTTTSDEIGKRAKMLSMALGLSEPIALPTESLISVLLRPTGKEASVPILFARNLIVTIYASAQFITAAAHADDYSRYPVLLLRSVSLDLRNVLDSMARTVERLR